MDKMIFVGNFTTQYVFPEVITTYNNSLNVITGTWLYQHDFLMEGIGRVVGYPIAVYMLGRDYTKDPPR